MSPQNSTRSLRSGAALTVNRSDVRHTRAHPHPTTAKSGRISKKITRPRRKPAVKAEVDPDSSLDGASLDGESEADKEGDADPSDQADVLAPSSGSICLTEHLQPSVASVDAVKGSSKDVSLPWTGPKHGKVIKHDSNGDESKSGGALVQNSAGWETDTSDNPEPNIDDDDYDEVDQVSNASEGSDAHEEQFERDIFADGEDTMDWSSVDLNDIENEIDLENDESFATSAYLSAHTSQILEDHGIALYGLEDSSMSDLYELANDRIALKPPVTMEEAMSLADSQNSDSNNSSNSNNSSRRGSQSLSGASQYSTQSFELDEDSVTDSEEPPSINSPAITLARPQKSRKKRKAKTKIITDATPRKHGVKLPVMRRMATDPTKAIAFSTFTPYGKRFHFRMPESTDGKWIRIKSTPASTEPNSPTAIDVHSAIIEGNTRTGALITDVINGRLFQSFHCGLDMDYPLNEQYLASEFAKNAIPNRSRKSFTFPMNPEEALEFEVQRRHDDALALIDLDAGVKMEEESSAPSTPVPAAMSKCVDPSVPTVMQSVETSSPASDERQKSSSNDESVNDGAPPTPTTPRPSDFLNLDNSPNSARKRRGSGVSDKSQRSVTPRPKRKRLGVTNGVSA